MHFITVLDQLICDEYDQFVKSCTHKSTYHVRTVYGVYAHVTSFKKCGKRCVSMSYDTKDIAVRRSEFSRVQTCAENWEDTVINWALIHIKRIPSFVFTCK